MKQCICLKPVAFWLVWIVAVCCISSVKKKYQNTVSTGKIIFINLVCENDRKDSKDINLNMRQKELTNSKNCQLLTWKTIL